MAWRSTGINPNDIESIEVLKDAIFCYLWFACIEWSCPDYDKEKEKRCSSVTFEASLQTRMWSGWLSIWMLPKLLLSCAIVGHRTQSGKVISSTDMPGGPAIRMLPSFLPVTWGWSIPARWKSVADPLDPSKTLILKIMIGPVLVSRMLFGKNYYVGIEGGTENWAMWAVLAIWKDSGVGVGTAFDRFNARTNVTAKSERTWLSVAT